MITTSWRARPRLASPWLFGSVLFGIAACASGTDDSRPSSPGTVTRAAVATTVADPDEFLVVDCMLPAQVKRLGSRLTYLGARRPVRTSGLDCAIRGGEYVAYDRADYQTALRVWMEPALAGDPEAQNYVGEILERGLGTAPDYAEAANWYRKAADQGFTPAQINLGQLYEQGLGVEKDPVIALNWYRKAADFEQAGLTFVASADTAAEIDSLRSQVGRQSAEAEQLQDDLRRLQIRIAELRQQQGSAPVTAADPAELQELQAARAELEQTRMEIEAERAGALQARQELEAERARLEAARDEARAAAAEVDRERAELDAERARLQAQEEELQLKIDQATSISVEEAARRDLGEVEARLRESDAQEEALDARERTLAERASDLDRVEAELEARIAQLQEMKATEAELQASMTDMRQEKSALDQEIDQLRTVFEEQRRRLEQMNETSDIALAGPTITLVDPPLPETLTRGTPIVRTRRGVPERQIVGRIDAPAGVLTLVVNDLVVPLEDKNLFRAAVPVSDQGTRVSVVAIDRQGKRDDLEFLIEPGSDEVLARPAEPEVVAQPVIPDLELGNFHALVIGNNEYQFLPDLESALTDARAVAGVLSDKYGFEVTLLENANRYQILSVLNELRGRLTENDNLLIYYAGHGELDRANQRGHWLPVDAEVDSSANWISNVQITDILNAMSAKRILVVADSCYSGALTRAAMAKLESGLSDQARLAWLKAVAAKRARTALTSGGLAPTMDGGGGDHSVFAAAFIDVLEQNDGLIEGQRLFQEISARVTYAASQYRFEQVPQYAPIKHAGHEAGEFFLRPSV